MEYPQSMFWSISKKNRYTLAYPSFTILKWGLRGYSLHGHIFLMFGSVCYSARVGIVSSQLSYITNEPQHEKTGLLGFRPGLTQTSLYSHRKGLEA